MTTNQTIDGVPRELLERAISAVMQARGKGSPTERDLRALLDAPACSACNDTGRMHEPGCEPGSCTACLEKTAAQPQDVPVLSIELVENKTYGGMHIRKWENTGALTEGVHFLYSRPAEQPQGEPVALTIQQRIKWMMYFNADLYEDWLGDNIPEDELPVWLTEEGVPESLPGSQLSKVLSWELQYANSRLAEQPAPVAVVLPERLLGDDGVCTESHYASGWNACLDELKRLNPSL